MFHAVWLQQLEHGQLTWDDDKADLRYRQVLVWHPATATRASTSQVAPPRQKKQPNDTQEYNVPAKPGIKACQVFNQGACSDGAAHLKESHICTYYLGAVKRLYMCTKIITAEGSSMHWQKLHDGAGPTQTISLHSVVIGYEIYTSIHSDESRFATDYDLDISTSAPLGMLPSGDKGPQVFCRSCMATIRVQWFQHASGHSRG